MGKSSLNPNAASFVPLIKLGAEEKIEASKITRGDSESSDKTSMTKPSFQNLRMVAQNQFPGPSEAAHSFNIHQNEEALISGNRTLKGHAIPGSHDSLSICSIDITEREKQELDAAIDLARLALMFPGFSEVSLADVYSANGGDLEASAFMLDQLQLLVEDSQHLPDSLDVGGMATEGMTVRLNKNISGESSGSSSGASPSESAQ